MTSHWFYLAMDYLSIACGIFAVCGIAYTLITGALVKRFFAKPPSVPRHYPDLTVIKPLHGMEWALLDNLVSFCRQDYPGNVQYLFGVHDENDAALLTIATLKTMFPDARIDVVIDSRLYGPNRKMSNILNMLPQARHDVLIFADSDVSVDANYLRGVIGALHEPGVGLVTCLYRGQPDPGFWPKLSAKATNYHFLPSVVTGLALNMAHPCFGQTIALRRETLDKMGGFSQFVHHLAEDHAIGEAVRRLGYKVAIPSFTVTHACVETTARKLFSHELRWSRTIRSIDAAGHIGSAVVYPFAWSLLCVLFSHGAHWAWTIVALAMASRALLKWRCDQALHYAGRGLWLLPLWDIASFGIFISSFLSSRVVWRGFSFEVGTDGLLYPVADE